MNALRRLYPPGLVARLRADVGIAFVVVLVVGVTAGTANTVGRSLDVLTTNSVQDELTRADPAVVGVTSTLLVDRALARTGAMQFLAERERQIREELPAPLPDVTSPASLVVDSVRFQLGPLPGEEPLSLNTLLTIRAQAAGDGEIQIVNGRTPAPSPAGFRLPGPTPEQPGAEVPVHEVALSATTMERVGLTIGDRLLASPDLADPLARQAGLIDLAAFVIEVVGEVELSDPSLPTWWGDPRLHRPAQLDTGFSTTYFAFGWVPLDQDDMFPGTGGLPARVEWRARVSPSAVTGVGAEAALDGARSLAAANAGMAPSFNTVVSTSRLDRLLTLEAARRRVAVNILRLGMTAIGGVGVAVLVLLALLLGERRRDRTALTMGRGASRGQLLSAAVVEALLLSIVGGVVGFGISLALVTGVPATQDLVVVGGVAIASAVALIVGSAGGFRRPLRDLLTVDRRPHAAGLRRTVLEVAVVLVAVAGVVALRRRGVDSAEPDAFVVAVPVIVGLAGGLVVRRLYRLPLRAAAAAAGRQRGLALPIGLARGARGDLAGPMVVVVVLAVAVALFSGAVTTTIRRGQAIAAWEDVGAPARVDADSGAALGPIGLPGATVVDAALQDAAVNAGGDAFGRADVLAVDLAAMEEMLADAAAPLVLPSRALRPVVITPGGAPPLLPMVVSVNWFNNQQLSINDQVDVSFETQTVTFQVVAFRRRILGLDEDQSGPFVLVPRAETEAILGTPLPTTVQFVDLPASAVPALRAAASEDAVITTLDDVMEVLADQALPRGVAVGFLGVAVVALLFAALAMLVWQALTARRRVRDLAILAAVGARRGTRFVMAMAEVLPAVLLGVLAGAFVGAVSGDLLDGIIDLSPFTTTPTADQIVAASDLSRWGTLGIVVASVILISVVTWRGDRAEAPRLLRED